LCRRGAFHGSALARGRADRADRFEDDEWILLVTGSAGLWIEGEGERDLRPGDHVLIPAHRPHRVTWTAKGEPTVWLAVHLAL
jgi:mannose-6-phosphate isomerase-like protein (cupin superfamily)